MSKLVEFKPGGKKAAFRSKAANSLVVSQQEIADYVRDMAGELEAMSRKAGLVVAAECLALAKEAAEKATR